MSIDFLSPYNLSFEVREAVGEDEGKFYSDIGGETFKDELIKHNPGLAKRIANMLVYFQELAKDGKHYADITSASVASNIINKTFDFYYPNKLSLEVAVNTLRALGYQAIKSPDCEVYRVYWAVKLNYLTDDVLDIADQYQPFIPFYLNAKSVSDVEVEEETTIKITDSEVKPTTRKSKKNVTE